MRKILLSLFAVLALCLGLSAAATADTSNRGDLRLTEYGHNAPGTDDSSDRNAEFVKFVNTTGGDVDIEGWVLHDSYKTGAGDWGNRYVFKGSSLPAGSPFKKTVDGETHFVVPAGGTVYVYNGAGTDTTPTSMTAAIYRDFKHHYNNAGDTIQLDDKDGDWVWYLWYNSYREKLV